jgi:hypothetical protein
MTELTPQYVLADLFGSEDFPAEVLDPEKAAEIAIQRLIDVGFVVLPLDARSYPTARRRWRLVSVPSATRCAGLTVRPRPLTRDVQFLWRSRQHRSPARWRPDRRNLRGVHYLGRHQDRRRPAER